MADTARTSQGHNGRAVTAPKGRPTPKRGERYDAAAQQRARRRRIELIVIALIAIGLVVGVFLSAGSGGSTPTHLRAPVAGHGG